MPGTHFPIALTHHSFSMETSHDDLRQLPHELVSVLESVLRKHTSTIDDVVCMCVCVFFFCLFHVFSIFMDLLCLKCSLFSHSVSFLSLSITLFLSPPSLFISLSRLSFLPLRSPVPSCLSFYLFWLTTTTSSASTLTMNLFSIALHLCLLAPNTFNRTTSFVFLFLFSFPS